MPSPVTLAPEMRGRTTQNCVSSTRNSSVLGAICAVGDHALMIVREPDRRDRADVDAVVVDLGLAGLQPFGRLEHDRDLRPLAADPRHGHPDADHRRQNRDEPDQRRAASAFWAQPSIQGLEESVGRDQAYRTSLELAASQISRGSKDSTASIVSTTTAAKKNRPGPGSTDISGWS